MNTRDEHTTPRAAQGTPPRRAEPGGWEEKAGAPPGWERRNERRDRLREGQDHPLHHGRTLHGDHAFDGDNEVHPETERRRDPTGP